MKVKIKHWVPVAVWKWPDLEGVDDVCGICRAPFEATCPTCAIPGFDCPPITGECSHSFHYHCILKWLALEKTERTCPMCRQPFVSEKMTEVDFSVTQSSRDINDSILDGESLDIDID